MRVPAQVTDRRLIVAIALAGGGLAAALALMALQARGLPDFAVLWAAQQTSQPYDPAMLRATIDARGGEAPRSIWWPFPYPPTFLLLTSWFAPLSYSAAFVLWATLSGAALVGVCRHSLGPLVLLSPWVLEGLVAGQTSAVTGALIYAGLSLGSRPVIAGALLALAACIKPQLGVFIPLGLIVAGQWRLIASAAAFALGICATATLVYGPEAWPAWLRMLQDVSLHTEALRGHLDLSTWPLKALALALGLPLLWRAFRKDDADAKLLTSCGLALLVMPHSLWYNATVMAPGLVGLASRGSWRGLAAVGLLLLKPISVVVAAAVLLSGVAGLRRRSQEQATV